MEGTRTQRATELAQAVGEQYGTVTAVTRFPTGTCHYVFDVDLGREGRIVVRIADPERRPLLLGALEWSALLRPLGVPLPAVLAHDVDPATPLPYLVLERLPGDDLGLVCPSSTPAQRRGVAASVVAVQAAVHRLGPGSSYGYCTGPAAPPPCATWTDVVLENLRRSAGRLRSAPPDLRRLHGRVVELVAVRRAHLDRVAPIPFLDDLTTKNVLVHDGRLSGVVDVDVVCFGDPLFTPALTMVSLVASDFPTDYVDAWLRAVRPDGPALAAFDLYCAVFCLDLLSEAGVTFNRDEPVVVDSDRTERLVAFLSRLVSR